MQGSHLLAEFFGCQGDDALLTNAEALRKFCLDKVVASGLTIVGESFYQFEPQGATGAVVLAESHLAIHTWPEHRYVSLDIFVCNYTMDNTSKAMVIYEALKAAFHPTQDVFSTIARGEVPKEDAA